MSSSRPQFVYDDACGFCTWVARFVAARSDVELVGFSELSPDQRARLPADYDACAHLLVDGTVRSCGRAIEAAVARAYPSLAPVFAALRRLPGYPPLRETAYRWGANHRGLFGRFLSREPRR